jgi:hypothetical protein
MKSGPPPITEGLNHARQRVRDIHLRWLFIGGAHYIPGKTFAKNELQEGNVDFSQASFCGVPRPRLKIPCACDSISSRVSTARESDQTPNDLECCRAMAENKRSPVSYWSRPFRRVSLVGMLQMSKCSGGMQWLVHSTGAIRDPSQDDRPSTELVLTRLGIFSTLLLSHHV